MKRWFSLSLIVLSLNVSAQFRSQIYSSWDSGYSVGTYGRYQASSNAITTNLFWKVYQGKNLERSIREKVSGMHGKLNRAGAELDYGIFAKHVADSTKGIGWFIHVANRSHLNAKYPKEIFDFAAFGNAQYAGQNIILSPIDFNLLSYSQFEIGLLKTIKKDKGSWNIGFGLSLLTGKQNLQIKIAQAELYTDPDGEYLQGEVHGEIRSSSMRGIQYFDANGLGFSGSFNLGYQGAKFGLLLQMEDIGIISWSKAVNTTDLDSAFVFEGVDINLFASGGPSATSFNLDSIIAGVAKKTDSKKYSTVLPGSFRLEGNYMLNEKNWKVYAGVHYRITPSYFPYIYVGTESPLGKGFFIDGRFAYGGFGSWNLGLEVRKRFSKVFDIRVGTNNLEGYVLPMVGTSQSLYIGLTGLF